MKDPTVNLQELESFRKNKGGRPFKNPLELNISPAEEGLQQQNENEQVENEIPVDIKSENNSLLSKRIASQKMEG